MTQEDRRHQALKDNSVYLIINLLQKNAIQKQKQQQNIFVFVLQTDGNALYIYVHIYYLFSNKPFPFLKFLFSYLLSFLRKTMK